MTENPAARIGAVEEMLTERGVVDAETVERVASYYETQVGPMVGAGVVARSPGRRAPATADHRLNPRRVSKALIRTLRERKRTDVGQ